MRPERSPSWASSRMRSRTGRRSRPGVARCRPSPASRSAMTSPCARQTCTGSAPAPASKRCRSPTDRWSSDVSPRGVTGPAAALNRGLVDEPDPDTDTESWQALHEGKRYALVVGIDDYGNGIPPLRGAIADARAVATALADANREDHYEVITCFDKDASRAGLAR